MADRAGPSGPRVGRFRAEVRGRLARNLDGGLLRVRGRIRPRLRPDEGRTRRRLLDRHGHKMWTSLAHMADWCFVLCRT
jgi:alkylation response protein AidB-like acyl-CoA dehydrogenase